MTIINEKLSITKKPFFTDNSIGARIARGFVYGFVALGLTGIVVGNIQEQNKRHNMTPEQVAAEKAKQEAQFNAWRIREAAREAERARLRPIIEENKARRATTFSACVDQGNRIPNDWRFRKFVAECMAGQGYQFSGETIYYMLGDYQYMYDIPGESYSMPEN